jgi:hypothetical protein
MIPSDEMELIDEQCFWEKWRLSCMILSAIQCSIELTSPDGFLGCRTGDNNLYKVNDHWLLASRMSAKDHPYNSSQKIGGSDRQGESMWWLRA